MKLLQPLVGEEGVEERVGLARGALPADTPLKPMTKVVDEEGDQQEQHEQHDPARAEDKLEEIHLFARRRATEQAGQHRRREGRQQGKSWHHGSRDHGKKVENQSSLLAPLLTTSLRGGRWPDFRSPAQPCQSPAVIFGTSAHGPQTHISQAYADGPRGPAG